MVLNRFIDMKCCQIYRYLIQYDKSLLVWYGMTWIFTTCNSGKHSSLDNLATWQLADLYRMKILNKHKKWPIIRLFSPKKAVFNLFPISVHTQTFVLRGTEFISKITSVSTAFFLYLTEKMQFSLHGRTRPIHTLCYHVIVAMVISTVILHGRGCYDSPLSLHFSEDTCWWIPWRSKLTWKNITTFRKATAWSIWYTW